MKIGSPPSRGSGASVPEWDSGAQDRLRNGGLSRARAAQGIRRGEPAPARG